LLAWALASCAHASDFSLPAIFTDHLVLQREQPVGIWGDAPRGEKVELHFGELHLETHADARGRWRITLPSMDAGGPFELTVRSGAHAKTLRDVFVGEVWLAAGQSNMAFRFRFSDPADQAAALRSLHERNVRNFALAKVVSGGKLLEEEDGPWGVADVNSIAGWSAVGVYFSQSLGLEKHVAIGIIDVSQGSSTIEAWMSEAALAHAKAAGDVPAKPYEDIRRHYRNPAVLYRSMLAKVVPYGIRGVLWYQGESNAGDAASYQRLLPALIGSWRTVWERPDLPFIFAQLPAYEPPDDESKQSWARFRAAQANVHAAVPGTGMAVLIDTGEKDDIHPADKKVVGERFARLARALVYGEDIAHSGPLVEKVEYVEDFAVIHFSHAEGGLVAAGDVEGFEVQGGDGAWRHVVPRIDGQRLLVGHPEGDEITGVRHAWANAPTVNLYNQAGLPAAPFSVERSAEPSNFPKDVQEQK
jgi:sialate O-acetylesterase